MKLVEIKIYEKTTSKFLFNLRNKSYVRENSINKKILKYNTHIYWLRDFLNKKNRIFIIYQNKTKAGYIRLQKINKHCDVSWAILKKFQMKGLAKKSLINLTKNKKNKYRAVIKKNNITSIKVALNSNFRLKLSRNNIQYYYKN
tara:strand:- start:87 stop:518 length:432 start_codon:yes stop_codon:yes gene_type:complete